MDDAAVFIATLLILLLGIVLTRKLSVSTNELKKSMKPEVAAQLDPRLQPDALTGFVSLWVDRSQAVSLLVPPLLGISALARNTWMWNLAFLGLIAALVCVVVVMLPHDTTTYGARQGKLGMSWPFIVAGLVAVVGLLASLAQSP